MTNNTLLPIAQDAAPAKDFESSMTFPLAALEISAIADALKDRNVDQVQNCANLVINDKGSDPTNDIIGLLLQHAVPFDHHYTDTAAHAEWTRHVRHSPGGQTIDYKYKVSENPDFDLSTLVESVAALARQWAPETENTHPANSLPRACQRQRA